MDKLNVINIKEEGNRLLIDTTYTPVVCGNSNYYLQFTFDSDWQKCEHKTAIFIINGEKFAVEFTGDMVEVPPLPNADYFHIALTSSFDENTILNTTTLRLRLESSPLAADMSEFDVVKGYLPKLIGLLNKYEKGEFKVKSCETAVIADSAENATYAETSTFATTAGNATTAESAVNASNAATAETANRAITADSATVATKAITADRATIADKATTADSATVATKATTADSATIANKATTADSATTATTAQSANTANYATTAGSSETQVDLTSNQTISGLKNFAGGLKVNNKDVVLSDTYSTAINNLNTSLTNLNSKVSGLEISEVIYDRTSPVASINKGYTSGIVGGKTVSMDFTKYKMIKVYMNMNYCTECIIIDLTNNFWQSKGSNCYYGSGYVNNGYADIQVPNAK